jgi:hypothetical protein
MTASMLAASLAFWLGQAAGGGEAWRLQFFLDEDRTSIGFTDLKFLTPKRGLAVGVLEKDGNARPVAVITDDGGETWRQERLREVPRSLYFLNDSLGWMVTEKGLWTTEEGGRSWRKISRRQGVLRVHFADARRGWAVGAPKLFLSTADGGRTWTPVKVSQEPPTTADRTVYTAIEFASSSSGMVVGWSAPRGESRLPPWMAPEQRRMQGPTLTVRLWTQDGGNTWTGDTGSVFGRITRLSLAAPRRLFLVEFQDAFEWPAEVHRIGQGSSSSRVYRERDRAVTDLATVNGVTYLAAIEPAGRIVQSPIPGRVIVVESADLQTWRETSTDYRVSARRAMLAWSGDEVWLATDTGMILRRVR